MKWLKKQLLGVDLGQRTVKGVKLKLGKDGRVKLTDYFFQDLAQTSENFPTKTNREEAFKAAIEVQKLGSSHVSTTVRDSEVMSFNFSLPAMSEKELAQAVTQEIAEQANIEIDDHSCDFKLAGIQGDDPDLTKVVAYCVKRETVLEQMKKIKQAGLKPAAIETEMMAITAMINFNGYSHADQVSIVFDLGESHLTAGLIVNQELVLTRSHPVAFGLVNQTLQSELSLSYEEAEKLKLGYDFLSVNENGNRVHVILDESFTKIVKSIKEAIDFFKECAESNGRLDQVLLVGGASQLKGIHKIIETFFKVQTTVVNPFRNIDIFTSHSDQANDEIATLAPFMGTAVGLALASVESEGAA